jgi:hypothetical protein
MRELTHGCNPEMHMRAAAIGLRIGKFRSRESRPDQRHYHGSQRQVSPYGIVPLRPAPDLTPPQDRARFDAARRWL